MVDITVAKPITNAWEDLHDIWHNLQNNYKNYQLFLHTSFIEALPIDKDKEECPCAFFITSGHMHFCIEKDFIDEKIKVRWIAYGWNTFYRSPVSNFEGEVTLKA